MKCETIKELIITGYSDGEISPDMRKELEDHLKSCTKCREFERSVRETVILPFRSIKKEQAPHRIWYGIKDAIEKEKAKAVLPGKVRAWQVIFRAPKPVLAFATIATVVLIIFTLIKTPSAMPNKVNLYLTEQIEFLSDLKTSSENGYAEAGYIDLGTDIERYFL